jgi:hypothetical protein
MPKGPNVKKSLKPEASGSSGDAPKASKPAAHKAAPSKSGASTPAKVNPGDGHKPKSGPGKKPGPTVPVTVNEKPKQGANGEIIYPDKVPAPWFLKYQLSRKMNISKAPIELLEFYPGSYAAEFPLLGVNRHGALHYERAWLEQDALFSIFNMKARSVLDVAGNIKRSSRVVDAINNVEKNKYKDDKICLQYMSNNPILTGSDAVRGMAYADYLESRPDLAAFCDTKILQETGLASKADVLLLNHVLYYISCDDLMTAICRTNKKRALCIIHHFVGPSGSFPGAEWKKDGRGNVTMLVEGNSFAYNHGSADWVREKSSYTCNVDGKPTTMCWSLSQEGLHQHVWTFVIVPGVIPSDATNLPEDIIRPEVVTLLSLTHQRVGPYGVCVWTCKSRPYYIIPSLFAYAKTKVFMGRKPDQSSFRAASGVCRSKAEDIMSLEIRSSDCYTLAFVQTLVAAWITAALEWNESQAWVADLSAELTKMDFGIYVERDLSLSEKATNAVLTSVNVLSRALPFLDGTPEPLISGSLLAASSVDRQSVVSVAKEITEPEKVVPFLFAVDPDLSTQQVEERIKGSRAECERAKKLRANVANDPVQLQNVLAATSVRRFLGYTITPNRTIRRSRTPYCFSRFVGPALLPDTTSTATIASAMIHRLYDGKEHLDHTQTVRLKSIWQKMVDEKYLPDADQIAALKEVYPTLTSRLWLNTQYGRRNEPAQVNKLMVGIAERESGIIRYHYQFFVKTESAAGKGENNKGRGIFDPDPTYSTLVNPFYHSTMKSMCAFYSPKDDAHTVIAAGLTAPEVAKVMGAAIERFYGGIIIANDAISYEANQTVEHTDCVINVYTRFEPPPAILEAICKMKNIEVVVRRGDVFKCVFTREGGMASGIGDVSLRNSLNTIMSRVDLLLSIGYTIAEIMTITFALILGDDNWIVIAKDVRNDLLTPDYVKNFFETNHGWKMKCHVFLVDNYAKSDFCSMYPVWDGLDWILSMKPGRFFSKTLMIDPANALSPAVQLRGMVRGAAHFKQGWLMSRCLRALDKALSTVDLCRLSDITDTPWLQTPKFSNHMEELSAELAILGDCSRYDLTERDIRSALSYFETLVETSKFPQGPIIIGRHYAWDVIFRADIEVDETDFATGLRFDKLMPSLNDITHIPCSWYDKEALGYIPIHPGLVDRITVHDGLT